MSAQQDNFYNFLSLLESQKFEASNEKSKLEMMDKFLTNHPEVVSMKSTQGSTALHYAAMAFNIEAFECLLKHGANINETDNFGITALDLAKDERNPLKYRHNMQKWIENYLAQVDTIQTPLSPLSLADEVGMKKQANFLESIQNQDSPPPSSLKAKIISTREQLLKPFKKHITDKLK